MYEEAFIYLEKFDLLNDSLESARDALFLSASKAEYEAGLAKAENQKLLLQQEANAVAAENDRLIKIGLIAGMIFLIVLSLLIFIAYKMKANALTKLSVLNGELNASHNQVIEQREELQRLNRLKTNIVSVLGHDLRGPLSNVSGLVSLLRDKTINEDEFEEIIRSLDEKTNTGLKSLDMILEWSRLKAGDSDPRIELIKPQQQIDEIISLNRESIADKTLRIVKDFDTDVCIPADLNQFLSIANNLISNAIKFSQNGGLVEIAVNDEKDQVTFSVKDSGMGFSEEVLQSLDKGKRLNSSTGSKGEKGTGIGLRIVSDFVDAHAGELDVRNHDKGGGVVSVSFPKKRQFAKAV